MPKPRVLIAADHAGVDLKQAIQKLMPDIAWEDLGPPDHGRVDYPDYAEKLARKIGGGEAERGVLVCGSGIGMSIAANKVDGVRAAVVGNPVAARLAKEHNNANVLSLGARFTAPDYAVEIIQAWLDAKFDHESRHATRVDKISKLEKQQGGSGRSGQ